MTTPRGFIETISDIDARPIVVAADHIMVITKLPPSAGGAKTMILLRGGERLAVGSKYSDIVERLALCVGDDEATEL